MSPTTRPALQAAFSAAIERFEYQGTYNGVFPVKANHDKSLIDAVLEYGAWCTGAQLHLCGRVEWF